MPLKIGGLARHSGVDWPGELVATVFLQGCPWRCSYCHNAHLLPADAEHLIAWSDVRSFLESRRGLLDGVVFSGGEPTMQPKLIEIMRDVRDMGFKIGLHSGGPFPEIFKQLLPLLSWVGFDVKAAFADYDRITGRKGSGEAALRSLKYLIESGVSFQARTTVHPALLSDRDMERLLADLAALGVHRHETQIYREPPKALDAA